MYGCPENCGHSIWKCQNGDKIFKNRVCDGEADCTDGSDENNCDLGLRSQNYNLLFYCYLNKVINLRL